MSINISRMDEQGKLEWLRAYDRQTPNQDLRNIGKITARDAAGQPSAWDYIPPEEAIKTIIPKPSFGSVLGVKVEVKEKEKVVVEKEFIEAPVSVVAQEEAPKRGRKPKNV